MFEGYDMYTLLLVVVSFFSGVAIILSYKALKFFKHNNNSLKNAIIDNRIKQYADKLHVYDKAIADLKVKVDMLEMSGRSHLISRDIKSKKEDSGRDIGMISQNGVIIEESTEETYTNTYTNTYLLKYFRANITIVKRETNDDEAYPRAESEGHANIHPA